MHGNVTSLPSAKTEPKTRVITLTNRAPIRINEDEWPIMAQSAVGRDIWFEGDQYGWVIQIFFRRRKRAPDHKRTWADDYKVHEIIHAKYDYRTPYDDSESNVGDRSQVVRVGRMLCFTVCTIDGRMECQSIDDQWRHIKEIGDELRERIDNVEHRRQVTNAIDKLFEELEPHGLIE